MVAYVLNFISKHKYAFALILFLFLIATRFALLDQSARFIWDESDDLLRMKDIYDHKRITLVGPVAGNNINVYGSLSYYMLMPITVIMHFDPLGPAIGTAVYSVFFIVLFAYFLWKKMNWQFHLALIFLMVLFPFVQSGRWAWNPHYVPFWQIISLALLFIPSQRTRALLIAAGILQSLTIHNHWYAFFATFGSVFIVFFTTHDRTKRISHTYWYILGINVGLVPFLIFDFLRPPGLFISRLIFFSPFVEKGSFDVILIITRLLLLPYEFTRYFFLSGLSVLIFTPFFIWYVYNVIQSKQWEKCIWLIPVCVQIVGLTVISTEIYQHYYLPAVVFFVIFLVSPDKNQKVCNSQKVMLIVMVLLSIIPSYFEITKNQWDTNIRRTKKIVSIMEKQSAHHTCNVVALASKDSGISGKKYRDLLKLQGINFRGPEEYGDYDCLFVVSTSGVNRVMSDPAYEIDRVRNKKPIFRWQVEGWNVYQFTTK